MNLFMFISSFMAFIYLSILSYEIWFVPVKFVKRLDSHRTFMKDLLGFSYWTNGYVNWPLVKAISILALIVVSLSLIISFTGPFTY